MSRIVLRTALAVLVLVLFGCSETATGPGEEVIQVTLTHNGFDFSEGRADTVDYSNNDGDVIAWQPGYTGTSPQNTLWWRNDLTTADGSNATADMGAVALASVTEVPAQWEAVPDISPLLVGHVYVAKCHDGYVKFEVTALDAQRWEATVRYVFTTGTTF